MIELPEAIAMAIQLRENLTGCAVADVLPPTKPHQFCWFSVDPAQFADSLRGSRVTTADGFGGQIEICFDHGWNIVVNDGVNLRLVPRAAVPRDYQLLIAFEDGRALVMTVAMYGGIFLHNGDFDNGYYWASRRAVSPFDEMFPAHFRNLAAQCKPSLSVKAFLATEQRFPGVGNGVLQDILFAAHIHPKRKMGTMTENEISVLLRTMVNVLRDMTDHGGRDTEKDLLGQAGGYRTRLSRLTWKDGCPACGGPVTKEAYLGGAVYYCPQCQRLE